jgi:hypothetical protein
MKWNAGNEKQGSKNVGNEKQGSKNVLKIVTANVGGTSVLN